MLLEKVELQTTTKAKRCHLRENRQWDALIQTEQQIEQACAIIHKTLTEQQLEEMMQVIEEIRLNGYNIKM
jgi:hypothetical protein